MDLLSVLLHEYGHALGIEHSADQYDFMGTTLQPGVRRLPTPDEMALMAQLAGDLKSGLDLAGDPIQPADPSDPSNSPLMPTSGTTRGTVRTGRLRLTPGARQTFVDTADVPRYEVAANPTLTDAKLQTGTGWETAGTVAIGNGAAVMSENDDRQTRLNQIFIVGPNDRYLTFTVADIGLDDAAAGPDDAFEAALLDANSGESLLSNTGLTHNDAFLNLQADGSEHDSGAVTRILNADGSRTYRVNLSGIPAGTAVNLSFDLIGFGAAGSHVTIRDIRLGVPELRDDAATTDEDTALDIPALGNDLDTDLPGYAPVIVSDPVHGSVTLNADGSFTWKANDGELDSDVAMVNLAVNAVRRDGVGTEHRTGHRIDRAGLTR